MAEVTDREGRFKRRKDEEKDHLARNNHSTLLSGKLWQAFRWDINREGGVSPPRGHLNKDQAISCGCLPGETPQHACTPSEKYHVRGL